MKTKILGFIYLDEEDIKEIHNDQLISHGGQQGIRNLDGLRSAIAQPQSTFSGQNYQHFQFL